MKKALLIILLSFQFIAHAQWTSYNLPQDFPVYYEFTDLIYSSKNTVWARYRTSSSPTYKSINGGVNFNVVNNFSFRQFRPLNDTIVFALNWYGEFVRSNDGGVLFSKYPIVNALGDTGFKTQPISDLYFYNDSVGWVLGDDTTSGCKEIWRTENGGILWQRLPCAQINIQNTPLGPNNFYKKSSAQNKLFLLNAKLKGENATLITVENLGKKWIQNKIMSNNKSAMITFLFIDSLRGFISLSNLDTNFIKTHDGGLSWMVTKNTPNLASRLCNAVKTHNKPGYIVASNINGAFISYDTAKTWIMIDDYWHSNISFYDAETGISMTQPTPQRNGAIHVFNGYLPDPVGLKENHQQSLNLKVFPNPAQHVIYVRASNVFGVSQISIYDVTGKEVHNQTSSQLQTEIPITHLNTGMYFLRMVSENGEISFGKFYVQN